MSQSTTDTPDDRLEQLLRQVHAELAGEGTDREELRRLASEVDEFVDEHETAEVVESAGVDSDGDDDPSSLVEAVQHADEASVARLRGVLLLSEFSSTDEEAADDVVSDLRDVSGQFPDAEDADANDDNPETEGRDSERDAADEDTNEQDEASDAEGDDSELQEEMETELLEAAKTLRGRIDDFRGHLETEQANGSGDSENEDGDEADEFQSQLSDAVENLQDRVGSDDENDEDEDGDENDDGPVADTASKGRKRFSQGRLSTMPSNRGTGPPSTSRFSTVRGKSNSDE